MPLTTAQAEVRIVPTMRGFQAKVAAGVKATKVDPIEIQVNIDKKSLAAAEAEAAAASKRLVNARSAERSANDYVAMSEKRLSDTRKYAAKDSAVLASEEKRLADARAKATSASNAAARAHADEARAKQSVTSNTERLAASMQRLKAAQDSTTRSSRGLSGEVKRTARAFRDIDGQRFFQLEKVVSRTVGTVAKLGLVSTAAAGALVGIGGATGPILAIGQALAAAAGAAALIPAAIAAAGAAFATLKIGMSGIGDAFKASGKAAADSGAAGAKAAGAQAAQQRQVRDALQGVDKASASSARTRIDGEKRVADAVESAKQTQVSGSRAIASAQAGVTSAKRSAADAEEEYRNAVKEATLAIRDQKVELKSSSLSVDEAQLSLEQAIERQKKLKAEGASSLDLRDADLGIRRATISLEEAKNRYTDVKRESATASAAGVKGAAGVVSAQRGVLDANAGVRDAETNLAEVRADAAKDNVKAQAAIREAQADAAQANSDAAAQVRDAQERLADAYAKTGDSASSSADKANEAMAELSPNAQAFVRSVLGMKDAWDSLKKSVQDRLFAGAAGEVKLLGDKYMPILRKGLGGIADGFNRAARETSEYLRTSLGVRQVTGILDNTTTATGNLGRAAAPVTSAFLGFAEIGATFLPGLSSGFADAAERVAAFVNSAAGAEKIKGWISGGLDALKQIWELAKNVGGIIGTVWRTMNEVGGSTLQLLVDLTGQANDWVKSVEGQEVLKTLFTTIRDIVRELEPGVKAVLGALKDAFLALAPSLPGLARAFSNILTALAPFGEDIGKALKWFVDNFLIPFGDWAKEKPDELRVLAIEILAVYAAFKTLTAFKKMTDWATGISAAFAKVRGSADKTTTALGTEGGKGGKGGKGLLGKLARVGALAGVIALAAAILPEDAPPPPGEDGKPPAKKPVGFGGAGPGRRTIAAFDPASSDSIFGMLFSDPGKLKQKFMDDLPTAEEFNQSPFMKFMRGIPNFFGTLGTEAGKRFSASIKGLKDNIVAPIRDFFAGIPGMLTKIDAAMGAWMEENFRKPIVNKASEVWGGVTGWFTRTKDDAVGKFTELKEGAVARITEAKDWVVRKATELKDGTVARFTEAKDWVVTRATELKDGAIARLTEAKDWVVRRATELKDGVVARFTEAKDWVVTRATELKDGAIARLTEAKDWVVRRATELKDGTIARLTEARDWVLTRARELKDGAIARLTEARDWVTTRARELKDGVVARLTEAKDWVLTRARELKDGAIARLTEARDWVITRARELKDGLVARITEAKDWVITRFTELKDGGIRKVTEAKDWILTRGTELKDGFLRRITDLVDGVGKKWDELRGFFAKPIKWVIDEVWNGTIADLWGKAHDLIPSLPEFQKLATGGSVRGPGTGTSDSIPALLSNGEHVITAREVRAMGGHDAVTSMREAALQGGERLARYAGGGPVNWQDIWGGVHAQFPQARLTSSVRKGDPGYHGKGKAADIAGPRSMDMPFMLKVNQWAANTWGKGLAELIHTQPGAVNLKNGKGHTYNGQTQADHRNHVHIAAGGGGLGSMIGGLIGDAGDWFSSLWDSAVGPLFDSLTGPIRSSAASLFPGEELSQRLPRDMVNSLLDGVRDVLFNSSGGDGGGMVDGGPTSGDMLGNARVIGNVGRQKGFARNGVVVALATALQESGLRNLGGGDRDSVGLFQQRPSQGWGSVQQIMNPSYAASKFFDALRGVSGWERMPVTVAAQKVQRSAFPNAYAKWVPKANTLASQVGFNNGGLIPGSSGGRDDTLVLAQSGERVLTERQNLAFEALAGVSNRGVSPALSAVMRGRDLAGVGASSAGRSVTGIHMDQMIIRETTDVDAAMSRASFLAGGL